MDELTPIKFNEEIVITTKTLAQVYECKEQQIQQNFNNNLNKFIEGKHYYKLEGADLKEFKNILDNFEDVTGYKKNTARLILWTKRGASRHCKMLGTDKSWEMFDSLEENYFNPKLPQFTDKQLLQLKILNGDELESIGALREYEQMITKPLLEKIEEDKPLVDFAETISKTSDSISIGDFAKLIKDEGVKLGRNKLFEWLRDNKYLMKDNKPYQKYIDNGYFEIIEYSYNTPYGSKFGIKTLITGIGQIKIIEKLRNKNN